MTPLTSNPTVNLLVENGQIVGVSTNVSADLVVTTTEDQVTFNDQSANKPFRKGTDNDNP